MKKFLLPLVLILVAQVSFGQVSSFFKPIPLPGKESNFSLKASANPTQYMVRPIASVTATEGNGTQLAGGFGISLKQINLMPHQMLILQSGQHPLLDLLLLMEIRYQV